MAPKSRPGAPHDATRPAGRGASECDEALLWQQAMRETKPLAGRRVTVPESSPTPPASSPGARPGATPRAKAPAAETESYADMPELQAGAAIGLDKRTAERLRRGQLPIEATMDLHGMTQAEAHRALGAFLARCHAHGRRSVLVITGKGARSEGGEGVLRATVPRWLNAPENRARVLAFAAAQPKDGGAGALYVLLRRLRDR